MFVQRHVYLWSSELASTDNRETESYLYVGVIYRYMEVLPVVSINCVVACVPRVIIKPYCRKRLYLYFSAPRGARVERHRETRLRRSTRGARAHIFFRIEANKTAPRKSAKQLGYEYCVRSVRDFRKD